MGSFKKVLSWVVVGVVMFWSGYLSVSSFYPLITQERIFVDTARRVRLENSLEGIAIGVKSKLGQIEGLLSAGQSIKEVRIEEILPSAKGPQESFSREEFAHILAMSMVGPKNLGLSLFNDNTGLVGAANLVSGNKVLVERIKKLLDDIATESQADILRGIEEDKQFGIMVRGYEGSVGHPGEIKRDTPSVGQVFGNEDNVGLRWIGDPVDAGGNASKGKNPSASIHLIEYGKKIPALEFVPDTRTLSILVNDQKAKDADVQWDRENMSVDENLFENLKNIAEKLGKKVKDLKISFGKGTRFDGLKKLLKSAGMDTDKNIKIQTGMYEAKGALEMYLGDEQGFKPDVVIGGMANEMVIASKIVKSMDGYAWIAFGSQKGLSSKVKDLSQAWELTHEDKEIYSNPRFNITPGVIYKLDDVVTESGYVLISSIAGLGSILKPSVFHVNTGNVDTGTLLVESLLITPSGGIYKILVSFETSAPQITDLRKAYFKLADNAKLREKNAETGYGITMVIGFPFGDEVQQIIGKIQDDLRGHFGNRVSYYKKEQVHATISAIMRTKSGEEGKEETESLQYKDDKGKLHSVDLDRVLESVENAGKFKIKIEGVSVGPDGAIVMKGKVSENAHNLLSLRRDLKKKADVNAKYSTSTDIYITIGYFDSDQPFNENDFVKLQDIIEKWNKKLDLVIVVDKVKVVYYSNRTLSKIIGEVDLKLGEQRDDLKDGKLSEQLIPHVIPPANP